MRAGSCALLVQMAIRVHALTNEEIQDDKMRTAAESLMVDEQVTAIIPERLAALRDRATPDWGGWFGL
jgi:hypothetical protein